MRRKAIPIQAPPHGGSTRGPAPTTPRRAAPARATWINRDELVADWDRYFDLFTWAPVGYVLHDLNGVVREVNQAAVAMLGVAPAAIVGRPLLVFIAKPYRSTFLEHMRRVRGVTGTVEDELQLQQRSGRIVPVLISSRRSLLASQTLCWSVVVDQTERERLTEAKYRAEADKVRAEAEQAASRHMNDAKDRFLATLSHELRTPLTPALFSVDMLERLALPAGAPKLLTMLKRNITLEAKLIDDLLDVTRIARDKLPLDRRVHDAHALLRESIAGCSMEAERKNLTLLQELSATHTCINADGLRMRQVFWNLLRNAIKFTPIGGRIVVSTINDESGILRVAVKDSGIGLDPALIPTLFEPFAQAKDKQTGGGLGLGLAISKGIVEAHGGRVWAASPGPGQGSTFEIELPTVEASPAVVAVPIVESPSAVGLHILLIEDHPDSAEALQTLLGLEGHAVQVASSVARAKALATQPWDVVISDLGLPDGTGHDVAQFVRAQSWSPKLMIALSGFGTPEDLARSREAGFDAHLIKPADFSQIVAMLREQNAPAAAQRR